MDSDFSKMFDGIEKLLRGESEKDKTHLPPPWAPGQKPDPKAATGTNPDDKEAGKRAKLAAQLTGFEASLKWLPHGEPWKELRMSIQGKIDDTRKDHKVLRPPAVARRKAMHDQHGAHAHCERLAR